jgi:hypothetical protein
MHFDGALSMFRAAHPDVLTLIAQPNLGWQRASRSDLHSTWWQRTPPFREAYSIARYLREAIIGQRRLAGRRGLYDAGGSVGSAAKKGAAARPRQGISSCWQTGPDSGFPESAVARGLIRI